MDFALSQFSEVTSGPANGRAKALWDHEDYGAAYKKRQPERVATGCALSRCPMCHNPVMFVVTTTPNQMRAAMGINSDNRNYGSGGRTITDFEVDVTYPAKPALVAHPTWPAEIATIFNETRQLLREGRRPFFVLAGCRSTLDVVTRKLGATTGSLKQRIDELQKQGVITKTLSDWAHALRLDGNEALHEGEVNSSTADADNAVQYVGFLELLLHMSFELAQAITERRKQPAEAAQ
ncbi:DUF4145 domain-containing protein [Bosea sp. (in: a-proteobacteria)]|uniref:DUF4145 domain-containing protein n=1 Tax=Bosea sp. (in: a-proteobacteria) TaxID=1871050 RepID=UPI001ACE61F9|nr:DUF4145 domain-containing protein [Bosea sp. (in: a-proteobacteria)]MBN9438962.1 DUF4145 domain-containing protein [Bosea sp. (in: a-proteobacteria)]